MTLRNWLSNRRCELEEYEHYLREEQVGDRLGWTEQEPPETWEKRFQIWVKYHRQKDV